MRQRHSHLARSTALAQEGKLFSLRSWLLHFAQAALGLGLAGCALFGSPDRIERARAYRTSAPSTWSPCPREQADACYLLPSKNVVTVTTSCGDAEISDPALLTRQLLMGLRRQEVFARDPFEVAGHPGLRTKLHGILDKRAVNLEVFTFSANDCVYDFALIGAGKLPEDDSRDFETFFKSFRHGIQ